MTLVASKHLDLNQNILLLYQIRKKKNVMQNSPNVLQAMFIFQMYDMHDFIHHLHYD